MRSGCQLSTLQSSKLLFLAVLVSLGVAATPRRASAEVETESSSVPTSETQAKVEIVPLREGRLPLAIHALGRIGVTRQTPAAIEALAAGVVSKIMVRDGESVGSGAILLRLDPRAAQAGLRKARSDLALAEKELKYGQASGLAQQQAELDLAAHQAQIKAEQAARESQRLAALLAKALVSEKAATEARQVAETSRREAEASAAKAKTYHGSGKGLELERLRAKVEEARAAASLAELEAEATTIRAPLAGRVTRLHATTGQTVDKGAVLVELEASEGIGASFTLTPAAAHRIKSAMPFALHDDSTSHTWPGTIIAVGAGLDPDSGLVRVEGLLDLKGETPPYLGQILPGEIVIGESAPGLVAPLTALSVSDEGSFVHRVDGQRKAHRAPVLVLAQNGQEVLLTGDGLKAGSAVIIDGNYNLPDGAGVVPKERPAHE